jgi:hypothetical protein
MFNLDEAITEWRRKMAAAGVKTPAPLDELESHLRDEVEQQVLSGSSEERAFEIALQRIGRAEALKTEFNKVEETTEWKHMKRTIIISVGIMGILAGMAFVMPAVAQYRHEGAMTGDEVLLFVLGTVLTLGGGGASFHGFRKRSA